MQNEDGRVWGSLIQLLQSWHPAFGELEFRPPAHHADPLPRRRSLRLLLQHPQTVGERGNAIPAKFQVVIEPAADQVRMRVVEARDHHSLAKCVLNINYSHRIVYLS